VRIALVCPFDPFPDPASDGGAHVGGVERVFAEASAALARRGHDVTVVTSTAARAGRTEENGVHLVRGHRFVTLLRVPVARLATRIPADAEVVHVAATYPFTTGAALRTARRRGVPVVLDFHFDPVPTGALGRAGAAAYRRIGPPFYPMADAVLARSFAYARSTPSLAAVAAHRLHVVPNGVDARRFGPRGPRSEASQGALLFVGRLVPYKGLEVLLHALAEADLDLPLVVAGDGPLREDLRRVAKELGVDARFLGRVPDADLPRLYRGARLTVLPSVNGQEAFGIVLLESMACGTPVVASDLPGVGDVARLGGWVARPGDPRDLADALRAALAAPPPDRAALAARIARDWSWDAVAERLEGVYARVVRHARAREAVVHARLGRDPLL
jgi:glycosyltransferase involved in cell wall biosynthesis